MSGYRRIEIYEPPSHCCIRETSIFRPKTSFFPSFPDEDELGFALDLLNPTLNPFAHHLPPQVFLPPLPASSHFDFFDSVTDLFQIEKSKSPFTSTTYKRVQERKGTDSSYLKTLCDRVSALETDLDRVVKEKKATKKKKEGIKELDRKYTWTTEIKSHEKDVGDRKYKWIAEIKAGEVGEKNYKWIAEIKGKGKDADASRTYTFKASTAPPPSHAAAATKPSCKSLGAATKKDEKKKPNKHLVEIEDEPVDHGTVVLKQAFARRASAGNNAKGKKKELSPQDAAMMIQMTFRAYLIRRSQALRALRELAVAKAKLKELRGLFNNFSYRRKILRDGEERQKFSERIIVLLLTVDAIEGADIMVRSARRSMIDELEAMLEVVDPQPPGKLGSMKRRKFDLPECGIQKEIAAGVAEVVHMLDQEERNGGTFEKNI